MQAYVGFFQVGFLWLGLELGDPAHESWSKILKFLGYLW